MIKYKYTMMVMMKYDIVYIVTYLILWALIAEVSTRLALYYLILTETGSLRSVFGAIKDL